MRTIIEVPDEIIRNLDQISAQQKKSRAATIREAIQLYLDERKTASSEEAFGLWKETAEDGLQFQERIRSEWDPAE